MARIIILGTGRSGTSLVAGLFNNAGLFMGDNPLNKGISNPLGYFEDADINELNNRIIYHILRWKKRDLFRKLTRPPMYSDKRAFWLIPPGKVNQADLDEEIELDIRRYVSHDQFCYKDPRFNITLEAWMPFLPNDTRFVVVFRDPGRTMDSIMRDAREAYVPPLKLIQSQILSSWINTYSHLIEIAGSSTDWLFVNSQTVIDGVANNALEGFTNLSLDFKGVKRDAMRSREIRFKNWRLSKAANRVYRDLNAKSNSDLLRYTE